MTNSHSVAQPIVLKPGMKIGSISAEDDDKFLFDCFVKHSIYDQITCIESPEMIIAGRTGSGKTAILRNIADAAENVVQLDPIDMSLSYVSNSDTIRFVQSIGGDLDLLFQALWKHVLCIEFIRLFYKVVDEQKSRNTFARIFDKFATDPRKNRSLQYLREWEGKFWITMDQNVKEITEKYESGLQAQIGGDVKKFKARGQYSKQLSNEKKVELIARTRKIINSDQLVELNGVIDLLAEQAEDQKMAKYYILIDKLDERWVDDTVRFRMIRALIESLRTFRKISNLKIVVALRSDVLERVVQETTDLGFQREKFDDYFVRLKWTDILLKDLIERRINLLFKMMYAPRQPVSFDIIFQHKVSNKDPFEYILERTLLRPRDVISFINVCLQRAEGRQEVTATCIRDAEREFSQTRRKALENEWQSAFPSLSKLLDYFGHRRTAGCTIQQLSNRRQLEEMALSIATADAQDKDPLYPLAKQIAETCSTHDQFLYKCVSTLYRVGAIGVKLSASERYLFSHIDIPIIECKQLHDQCKITIHPMLHRALGVGEKDYKVMNS